jgi:hypothetical protein
MIAKCLIALATIGVAVAQASLAGAAAGMDLELVKNVKNYVLPTILTDINTLKLPRIDYKGGYVENLAFNFAIQSNDSIAFAFDPVQNAVVLSAHDISGEITGNFKQRLLLVSATGKFKAAFKNGGISLNVVVPLHSQEVNGKRLPKLEASVF